MKFIIFFGIYLFCVVLNVRGENTENTVQCESGVAYQENDCNQCRCSGEHFVCTLKGWLV
ncbi:hypothetical protein ILUMI_22455 [Ignelater luminosus]|uniref:Pacifastin domain-containing protein n=1 Tax=Ignelater luminosus TaxID=2038154 RepID=A0A8K0CED8_IGNLU|nr:hypothetical protein ILUMI_22455 [Ignelater luminosus]